MAHKNKPVHISGQSRRFLKDYIRLRAIVDEKEFTMQYCTGLAIRLLFRNLVHKIQAKDLAHMLDDQLVRGVGLKIESRPQEPPQAGKEETTPKAPQADNTDTA